MKKLIFTFAFMLIGGTFTFGSYASAGTKSGCSGGYTTYISCGSTFHLCNSNYSSPEAQADFAQYMHELLCDFGTN